MLQSVLLKVCGSMTCLWSNLVGKKLLTDEDAIISIRDVLEVIQHSLVLLGNANKLLSQIRKTDILQLINQSLKKYGLESSDQPGLDLRSILRTRWTLAPHWHKWFQLHRGITHITATPAPSRLGMLDNSFLRGYRRSLCTDSSIRVFQVNVY